jgi:hypothetical protein
MLIIIRFFLYDVKHVDTRVQKNLLAASAGGDGGCGGGVVVVVHK